MTRVCVCVLRDEALVIVVAMVVDGAQKEIGVSLFMCCKIENASPIKYTSTGMSNSANVMLLVCNVHSNDWLDVSVASVHTS
jgi:hypothetical protein